MNVIKTIFVTLFLASLFANTYAQDNNDHLEPVGGIFDIKDFQFEYYSKIRKVLFKGLEDMPEIRFQVIPSFSPESVLDIELNKKTGKYNIIYHIGKKRIWYNDNWEKIKVHEYKKEIDKKTVESIKSIFALAISQTKYPTENASGFDGTNYYFSINEFGLKSGTTWSPPDGSRTKKLVDIGLELVELCQSKIEKIELNSELQKKIADLKNELKQNHQ